MRTRAATLSMLTLGFLLSTTGSSLAVSGLADSQQAAVAQYGEKPDEEETDAEAGKETDAPDETGPDGTGAEEPGAEEPEGAEGEDPEGAEGEDPEGAEGEDPEGAEGEEPEGEGEGEEGEDPEGEEGEDPEGEGTEADEPETEDPEAVETEAAETEAAETVAKAAPKRVRPKSDVLGKSQESRPAPRRKQVVLADEQPAAVAPSIVQATRQVSVGAQGGVTLPFTGFAALSVLFLGLGLLSAGLLLRRSTRRS